MAGTGLRYAAATPAPGYAQARRRIGDFIALMKPRPMSVVVLTAIAGLLGAASSISVSTALIAILCIALGGGGSAVLNMWFERDLDRLMVRTAGRPIAAGRVGPSEALAFAGVLIVASVVVMALAVNATAAAFLAATILFYGVVYTMWLKRATALNVVVGGGLASILTPLTGWAAATGGVSLEALALFAFLVPWTPPHVWSQALVRAADYARAGVPMMPVVAGSARTRSMIVGFTLAHALAALLPLVFGITGLLWAIAAVAGGVWLLLAALRLAQCQDDEAARSLAWTFYRHNSVYVVVLLAALVIERALGLMIPISAIAGLAG